MKQRRVSWTPRRSLTGFLPAVLAVVLFGAACTAGSDAPVTAIDPNPFTEMIKPRVTANFVDGAVGVSVAEPVTAQVEDGKFAQVTVLNPEGRPVQGALAADALSWASTEPLGYNKEYRLVAESFGLGGRSTTEFRFTTSAPANLTQPYLNVSDNEVVGIGQPVGIQFDEPIGDRKAVQDAITVVTEPQVDGAFYWISPTELRWRPEKFWNPGTKVRVDVNVYGKDLGGGVYGAQDLHTNFTIGDAVVLTADDNTLQVVVERNGQVINTMPTSMGKPGTPTDNGIYIVADKHQRIIMDSSTYGVPVNSPDGYKTPVDWATRISYSGIFFHSAPWSIGQQGYSNASHGCLNLSPDNAIWVFNNTKRGDITIVKNSQGGTLPGTDGLGDWNIPWDIWKVGNAQQS
ncbi:L,D-transpeptidase [Skermania piniformis]|uniref:L,D-transpeptidase family protein n=1 Tax=Skermania pinensis TaxID=39122 RepID=A0ABX8SGS1_9ACTN|nr:Ig-like domain-containing protein [Skermania piniformis]QXQ14881.1 L,D-transpeptidase family protein [Skermania piniformis]